MHNLTKKIFVSLVTVTLAVWTIAPAGVQVAKALSAGDLVKGPNSDAVYYIGADAKKYVFPDAKTYFTWYKNFDAVKTVTVTELDAYNDGGAVTYRPGTKMVTTVDTNKVYAVEPGGVLRWVPDEATALALYGSNWNKRINDVIPGYFSSTYTLGATLGSTFPSGSLIQKTGEATIYYVDGTEIRPFATGDAFEANGFDFGWVVTVSSLTGYTTGSSITGEESELSSIQASANIPVAAGTLSVSLASDTPTSGMAVGSAARLPFTKIKLTTGDNPVTIDQMVVKRGGLAQDAAFASVDILDGDTMIPFDANSKTFSSDHTASFNKDLTIAANTTKYIYLAGNMAANTASNTVSGLYNYAGEAPALGLSAITLTVGSTLNGTLPIFGNYQTNNGTILIGTATVSNGSYRNSTSTLEVGKKDYTFFSFSVASATEDGSFSQVSVYQEGTAELGTDLMNFRLLRDASQVAIGTVDGKYINFSFAPITIPKGQTYQFIVRADVEGGSARTVDLGIYRSTDLLVKGGTFGFNITPTYSGIGSSANKPVMSDNTFSLGNGTLTVERSSTVGSENIAVGNDQVLGAFKFTVKGEPMDITALTLTITSSTTGTITEDALAGVKLVNASGASVAGPTDVTNNALTVIFTDTFTLPVGETVLKVVGNMATAGGWTSNDTIYASLNTPASKITAEGQTTGNAITASPASLISTNTQTVKAAKLTVTRNSLPASGTIVNGQQDVVLSSWNFNSNDSGEDVRITSILWAASSTDVTNLTVKVDGTAVTPINDAPTAGDGQTSTFAFDTPIVITKGTSKTITLIGDVGTTIAANDAVQFGLTDGTASIVAAGVSTGNAATETLTADNGPLLTISAAGAVTVNTGTNPSSALVRAGATGVTFGYVKFDAVYEDLDLDNLTVHLADGGVTGTAAGTYQDLTTVYIMNGAATLGSVSIPSTSYHQFTFSNGTLTVPKDGSVTLTLKADVGGISSTADDSPATPAADVKLGLGGTDGFKFTGSGSNTAASETYNGSTTSGMVIHKAIPTVTMAAGQSALTNGGVDLLKFTVAAEAGGNSVLLYRSTFEITSGGGTDTTITGCILKDSSNNTVGASTNPTVLTTGAGSLVTFVYDNPDISVGDTKEAIEVGAGSSKALTLRCTIANAGTGDYVAVSLLGDAASSTLAASHGTPAATGQNLADAWSAYNNGNFIWSDNFKSRGLTTDGANATAYGQWYNGYLVSGLGSAVTTTAVSVAWSS